MKLIYQQVLSFFAVIAVTILLLGISFSRMTKSFMYNNKWDQLERYSDGLVEQSLTANRKTGKTAFSVEKLDNYDSFLKNQSIHFTVYKPSEKPLYPKNQEADKITSSEWKRLRNNQMIRKTNTITAKNKDSHPALLEVLKPYYYNDKLLAVIGVSSYTSEVDSSLNKINRDLLKALIISLVVAMIISFFISRRLNRRINVLRDAANQVTKGNYRIRLVNQGKDEIDELTNDFNHMAENLEKSDNEIQRQEERRQEFLADAAHEMRTPLTTINGILEGFKYDIIPEDARDKSLDLMMNETQRLIRLVNENLDYEKIRSNTISLHETNFNAYDAMQQLPGQISAKAKAANDKIVIDAPKNFPVYADYDRFVQIMVNISTNAIQFTKDGVITVKGFRNHEDNAAVLAISDTGIGMSNEQAQNIFERYYKADASRRSGKYGESGLGLAIVHQLVEQHGGTIEVSSELGVGTTFTITFPDENSKDSDDE